MKPSYLILAGTEKSGTTSVFQYLAAHPAVASSVRKETDYFRSPPPHELAAYEALFPGASSSAMRMEASPGYLAQSQLAAPAIAALIPGAKLLFILRDPIDRLLSSFEFHKSRFFIPEDMLFDAYVELCMRYERGAIGLAEAGLGEWFLRVPDAGRYAAHLRDYEAHFARDQIKVVTLNALQQDARILMRDVSQWAGLDAAFYDNYDFVRANVTFSPRQAWLQRLGLLVNDNLEPFFNRNPAVKQALLAGYKRINGKPVVKPQISAATGQLLLDYYQDDVAELVARYGADVADAKTWLKSRHPASDQASKQAAGQATLTGQGEH